MRSDYDEIKAEYTSIYPILERIAEQLEIQLNANLAGVEHVDRVICRAKSIDSFMKKSDKRKIDGSLKYTKPMNEIQDMVGARVVVYYKTDVETIRDIVNRFYNRVEEISITPDDVTKFGYEGFHLICFIPNFIFSSRENPLVSNFFELQIKTLYQHSWSQANHGLGYKPGSPLNNEEQRLLAFIAAQSWAADKALADLMAGQSSDY